MPPSRQLSAIVFTDIVGYTALMGDDEQKAFELLPWFPVQPGHPLSIFKYLK